MLRRFLFLVLFTFFIRDLTAQNHFGPKVMALGSSPSVIIDPYNTNGNPAVIAAVERPTIALSHLQSTIDKSLRTQIFSYIWPFKQTSVALNLYHYGIEVFKESHIGITVARRFGNLHLGVKINSNQLQILHYGAQRYLSTDVGMMYKLDTIWSVGLHVNHIKHSNRPPDLWQTSSTSLAIGTTYKVSDKILFATTIQVMQKWLTTGFGMDYQMIAVLAIRLGISTQPFKQHFGIGLSIHKLKIDIALQNDSILAQQPQLGVVYAF